MADAVEPPRRASDRIRETARELFYRQGIRAVGVDQIVTEAGVAKPSLYRAFASKDELVAAYLKDYSRDFFERFQRTIAAHPADARAQIRAWIGDLQARATQDGYRGCGITNAVVEHPDPSHPARAAAAENKRQFRAVLAEMARAMGARDPEALGDALMLLVEGAYAAGQLFGPDGPAGRLSDAAEALIDAYVEAPPARAGGR